MLDTCSRCYTRIAPWLTSRACVAHGLLRAQHFSASHRSQITPRSILGFPRRSRIAPFSAFPALCCLSGSLRCSALHALLAPGSDFSSPDSRVSHRSRIASRSILGLPRRARIAPVSTRHFRVVRDLRAEPAFPVPFRHSIRCKSFLVPSVSSQFPGCLPEVPLAFSCESVAGSPRGSVPGSLAGPIPGFPDGPCLLSPLEDCVDACTVTAP
jgi:hypothetical protein